MSKNADGRSEISENRFPTPIRSAAAGRLWREHGDQAGLTEALNFRADFAATLEELYATGDVTLHTLVEQEIGEDKAPFALDMFGTREVKYRQESAS